MPTLKLNNFYAYTTSDGVHCTIIGTNLNVPRYFRESNGDGTGNNDGVFVLNEMVSFSTGSSFAPLQTDDGRYYRGHAGDGIVVQADGFAPVLFSNLTYNIGDMFTLDTSNYVFPDTTPPAAPIITGISGDSGIPADGITQDSTLIVSGTAEANATVELLQTRDGVTTSLGTTLADGSGNWSFDHTGTMLAEGNYQFTARATDSADNTSAVSDAYAVLIDYSVPAGLALSALSWPSTATTSGATLASLSATDGLPLTYRFTTGNNGLDADNGRFVIVGNTLQVAGTALTVGTYKIYLKATDTANNIVYRPFTLTVTEPDTTPPDAPLITGIAGDGGTAGDGVTNDATLLVSGTAEIGATVTLFRTAGGNTATLGTTTADAFGHWTFDATGTTLADGSYGFTATATDAAHNTSAASAPYTVLIDTAPPSGLALAATRFSSTGLGAGSALTTLSATDSLTLTYAFATGNEINDADNGRFAISGNTLKVGATALAAGSYHIYLRAIDLAGNVSYRAETITIADPPVVTAIARSGGAAANVPAASASIDFTVTFSQSVSGVDASDFVLDASGSAGGRITAVSGSGTSYTVTVGDLSGDGVLRLDLKGSGTGIVAAGGTAIEQGYSSGETYAVDRVAPAAPAAPQLAAVSDTGASDSDGITSVPTPTISGTAEDASTVTLYDSDGVTVLGTATATGGAWSITPSLSEGSHQLTAKARDAAGNVSSASPALAVTIDTTGPATSAVQVPADGGYGRGDTLGFAVTLAEAVTVDTAHGAPRLVLDIGGVTHYALYQAGSSSATRLVFSYALADGLTDTNGIGVAASLDANGSIIRDAAGNDLRPALNGIGSTAHVLVDTAAPTVLSVSSPAADGRYQTGDTLIIEVRMSEPVTVTGTPQLTLAMGEGVRVLDYVGGTSDTLRFAYTVQRGDASSDLDYAGSAALALAGATVRDAAGNAAVLTLPAPGAAGSLGANKALVIDTATAIDEASYDASTGVLTVVARNLLARPGVANDIDVSKLSLIGEGGQVVPLGGANVDVDSTRGFHLTLGAAERAMLDQLFNRDGAQSTGGTVYNLAAAAGWAPGLADGGQPDLAGNAVHVSGVAAPAITSAVYRPATGVLSVTATGLKQLAGAANDIDVSKLSITGAGGAHYTLTSAQVDIQSGTEFQITLNAADRAALSMLIDQRGLAAGDGTLYNLAAAQGWARGADGAVPMADPVSGLMAAITVAGDRDGIPDGVEQGVPGLTDAFGGPGVKGDGNGDSIADYLQTNVSSAPFARADGSQTYLTLVADSNKGKPVVADGMATALHEVKQLAAASLPADLALPLGQLGFQAVLAQPGAEAHLSVYVDGALPVNGLWTQLGTGQWTNLATAVVSEGGKTRLDVAIVDGGVLDLDGKADGVVTALAGVGWRAADPRDLDGDQFPDALEAAAGLTVGVKDNDVLGNSKLFVMSLYRDILFREADGAGLAYWQHQLDAGQLTRAQVATSLLHAGEFQDTAGAIARLYFGALNRLPDDAGLGAWVAARHDGMALGDIAAQFVSSVEFQTRFGSLDNGGYIHLLYQNLLERPDDAAGQAYWTARLDAGVSRAEVLLGFSESAEYRAATAHEVDVALDYIGLLGRSPDAAGFARWVQALDLGTPEITLVGTLLDSVEYHGRFLG